MNNMMAGIAGNVIGGYLMGQQQREARREQAELEQKKLKMLLDAQKIKDAAEERRLKLDERKAAEEERKSVTRQKLIDGRLQQHGWPSTSQGAGQGLQFDESFGDQSTTSQQATANKRSLVDILSDDPELALLIKEETGTDYPAAVEARRKAQSDLWRQQTDVLNLMVRSGAGTYVDEQDPQTGAIRSTFRLTNPSAAATVLQGLNNFGGLPGPQLAPAPGAGPAPVPGPGLGARPPALGPTGFGGGVKSVPKPETRREINDGVEYEFEVNPYNNVEVPGSRRVAKEKQPMAGEAAGRTGMLASSMDSFQQLKALMMPGGKLREDWRSVVAVGNLPGPLSAMNPNAREYDTYVRNALTAKLRLETGANMPASELADLNARFRPSALDNGKLVVSKMDSLEKFLNGSIEMLDPNKKYTQDAVRFKADDGNTYAWTPGEKGNPTLPPAAAKSLKEGMITVFANGQRWTLRNGQPQQVP
jgi:hypothetical protein